MMGGTYLVVRRVRIPLDAWDALSARSRSG